MNSDSQPLVSVLTPVYNGEKHLPECIESVLAQTYTRWEYVIVNNCSTDRTLEIARHYADKDRRIRICNNTEFVGVIKNHNIALSRISAKSKYCKMLQADDWLFPECLMQMVGVAEEHPSVGVVGCYRLWDVWVDCDGLAYPSTVSSGREICRSTLLGGPYVFGSMSSVLIRSNLIRNRNMFYNEQNIHADAEACFDVLRNSDFGFVHQVLTYTRRHVEQISSFSWRFNARAVAHLGILKKYGPVYLTTQEYEQCWKESIDDYYRMLAKSIFKLREKEFWNYHKKAVRELGYSFSLPKLIQVAVLEAIDVLLEPAKVLRRQIQFARKNRKRFHSMPKDPCRPNKENSSPSSGMLSSSAEPSGHPTSHEPTEITTALRSRNTQ